MKTLAFISYSRKDKSVAHWLHSKLEKYPYPKVSISIENRPPDKKYLRPIFIDVKDLSVDEHPFNEKIKAALRDSRFLILICSKHSVCSEFVNKEVTYFLEVHNFDYSKIVPIFIDNVDDNIPPSIAKSSVMQRHFPIYNTTLSEKSEANTYCFYQIAAYLLGIDFSYLYNRYENYAAKRKKKHYMYVGILVLSLILIILSLFSQYRKQQDLAQFEKNVFPRSVMVGYVNNFLRPVISYMKNKNQNFKIYVLMPIKQEEILNHQKRIDDIRYDMVKQLGADSLKFSRLPTSMKRGSTVTTICTKDNRYNNIFLDFASTTSSFLEVAEHKKSHEAYRQADIDDLILEYANTFVSEAKQKLQKDSVFVNFYFSQDALVSKLKEY